MSFNVQDLRQWISQLELRELIGILPSQALEILQIHGQEKLGAFLSKGQFRLAPDQWQDLSVEQLELSVRGRNCLAKGEILKLGQFMALTPLHMYQIPHCGRTTVEEYMEVQKALRLAWNLSLEDCGVESEDSPDFYESLQALEDWINAWDPVYQDVYVRILTPEHSETYQEVASDWKLSRERIRQILERFETKLRGWMQDHPALRQWWVELCQLPYLLNFEQGTDVLRWDRDLGLLRALLRLGGFEERKVRQRSLWCTRDSQQLAQDLIEKIKSEPHHLREFDLFVHLTDSQLPTARAWIELWVSEGWLEPSQGNEPSLRMTLPHLPNSPEYAWRILSDFGAPMHYLDIQNELQIAFDQYQIGEAPEIRPRLPGDVRFVPIGRSGRWALREWNVDSRTIKEMLRDELSAKGAPMTLQALYQALQVQRPDLRESTLRTLLSLQRDEIGINKEGLYGLREWDLDWRIQEEKDRPHKTHTLPELFEALLNSPEALSARKLSELLGAESREEVARISQMLHRSPMFVASGSSPQTWLPADEWTLDQVRTIAQSQSERIRLWLIDLLTEAPQNQMLLTDAAELAEELHSVERPSFYSIVSQSPEFEKSACPEEKRRLILKLKETHVIP
jgi:hypothetical protein